MVESTGENILNNLLIDLTRQSKKIEYKKLHLKTLEFLGEKLHISGDIVKDESTTEKNERVVLQGTDRQTVSPKREPYTLRSGARSGCDASILLEIEEDGKAYIVLSHWEPTDPERKTHATTIQEEAQKSIKGKRIAVLVSGTLRDLQEAETTDLYRVMTEWNGGRKPDLVYIPFETIDWKSIARESLYQLVFTTKRDSQGISTYKIVVPGTTYKKSFTQDKLEEVIRSETTFTTNSK